MKKAFYVFIILLFPILGHAATKNDIAKCAAVNGELERLGCYDLLAKKMGVDRPITTIKKGVGKWKVKDTVSPIDDSRNVYLSLESDVPIRTTWGQYKPTLYLRCKEQETHVYITWNSYLGLDQTRILERFDKEEAGTATWNISTDNKATFALGDNEDFAEKLLKHKKFLAQVTPYGQSPVMAVFDLNGLNEAIKPLSEACEWEEVSD